MQGMLETKLGRSSLIHPCLALHLTLVHRFTITQPYDGFWSKMAGLAVHSDVVVAEHMNGANRVSRHFRLPNTRSLRDVDQSNLPIRDWLRGLYRR